MGENQRTCRKKSWPSIIRTWLSHTWPKGGSNRSGEKPNGLRVSSLYPLGYFFLWKLYFWGYRPVFAKSFQQMQDSCQTNWNFWQDKIKFCRTGGLSVVKLLSRFARNHRTFVRQAEIFCRTEWKFAGFVRQSCSFHKDWSSGIAILAPQYNTLIVGKVSWYDTILMNRYASTMLYLITAEWVANSIYPDETPHFYLGLHC